MTTKQQKVLDEIMKLRFNTLKVNSNKAKERKTEKFWKELMNSAQLANLQKKIHKND